jgi:hypothetical protein
MTTATMHSQRHRHTMDDSVTVGDIPRGAHWVAGYIDGTYANVAELRRRFPKAHLKTITTRGTAGADVCDRETGDLTAAEAANWAKGELRAGRYPVIYCNLAALREVIDACARAGIERNAYGLWLAHWTGRAHICSVGCLKPYGIGVPPRIVGTQYANPTTSGGHYDLSLIKTPWEPNHPRPRPPGHDEAHLGPFARSTMRGLDKRLVAIHAAGRHLAGGDRAVALEVQGHLAAVLK